MMRDGLLLLVWGTGIAVLIAFASWYAHRTYRRFLDKARGPASFALPVALPQTALDQLLAPLEEQNVGKSGLMLLLDNADAFAARALSAAQAGRSLDLMYYIWRTDLAGWLLIDLLARAAARGVRVRLLLDDVNVQGYDRAFLALTQHPLIEVRLFNPTRERGHVVRRMVEMALGLSRFNRRMHGKLWIADGRLAILGGRNIGDTDFGADEGNRIAVDADVMLVGPKVADVSAVFDSYWNLGLSLPIVALWPAFKADKPAFRKRLARHAQSASSRRFMAQILEGRPQDRFLTERLRWTDQVQLLADPPDKAYGQHTAPWMDTTMAAILDAAQTEVRLITPYFVPGRTGLAGLTGLAARGVKVSLVTSALSATDLVLVHGAYRHCRGPLLMAGASVFELSRPVVPGQKRDMLHSKVFIIDGQRAFIGSLNFDLRSAYTNTELGLLFKEPQLMADLITMFDTLTSPAQSYRLSCEHGALRWAVARQGLPAVMRVEPEAGWSRRAVSWIVGQLPIRRYL
jgi:cardiolipin synthase C